MRLTSTSLALVSFAAVVPALVAGCGSDDETTTSTTTSTTTTTSSSTSGGTGGMGGNTTSSSTSSGMGGMGGSGGMMTVQPNGSIHYWGDFVTDGTTEAGRTQLMDGTPSGGAIALMGIDGGDIRGFAVSPDGSKIAVGGLNMTSNAFELNVYNADGTGMVAIDDATGATNPTARYSRIVWSPDGTKLAYTHDPDGGFRFRAYVANADGTGTPQLVSLNPDDDAFAVDYVMFADNTHVVYVGDVGATDNVDCIWAVDITASVPNSVEMAPCSAMQTNQDVPTDYAPQVDSQGNVYFLGDYENGNQFFRLYRNTVAGGAPTQVPGTAVMINNAEARVRNYGLSPDGTQLAFSVETDTDTYNVYALDLSGNTPTQLTAVAATGETIGPDDESPLLWSADNTWIATIADWDVNNDFSAYVIAASGNGGGTRVLAPMDGDVDQILFNSTGDTLFVRGDLLVNGESELFATSDFATPLQDALGARILDVITDGTLFGMAN